MSVCRLVLFTALSLAASQASGQLTVADLVARLGVDTAGLEAESLARRTTSGDALAQGGAYVIATYEFRGDNTLRSPLHILAREPGGRWREARLTAPGDPSGTFGSITNLHVSASSIVAGGHLGPAAGNILVIRRADLSLQTTLDGWVVTMLPDGMIVHERSMIQFAPGSPGQLATFDPVTDRRAQLYPPVFAEMNQPGAQGSAHRAAFIERLTPIMKKWEATGDTNSLGFEPEWFSAIYGAFLYDAASDTLTFTVTLAADRHPRTIAPPLRDVYSVGCRPMRAANRMCSEK